MTVDKIFNKLGVGEFLFPKTNIEQSVYSPQYPYQFDMDVTQRKVFPNFVHENEPFDYSGVYTEPYQHHHEHSMSFNKKKSYALSALTLLAFLFFLNILQHSLKDQMNENTPVIIIITGPDYFDPDIDSRIRKNITSLKKKKTKFGRNKMEKVHLKRPSEFFRDEVDDESSSSEDLTSEPIGEEYIESEYTEV